MEAGLQAQHGTQAQAATSLYQLAQARRRSPSYVVGEAEMAELLYWSAQSFGYGHACTDGCVSCALFIDTWHDLYASLPVVARHNIRARLNWIHVTRPGYLSDNGI